jgi:hypothetical protein
VGLVTVEDRTYFLATLGATVIDVRKAVIEPLMIPFQPAPTDRARS